MNENTRNRMRLAALLGILLMLGAGLAIELRPDSSPSPPIRTASLADIVQPPVASPVRRQDARVLQDPGSLSSSYADIAAQVTPAVVRIQAERGLAEVPRSLRERLLPGGGQHPPIPDLAGGSGFIVTADGFVLTNHHVIEGAEAITVSLQDKREYAARVVGFDPTTDVALIKVEAESLPVLPLGDSEAAAVGEWVLAVGNPGFGGPTLDFTVTSGIISAKGRPLDILPRELQDRNNEAAAVLAIEDFIQTDAVINPGNSGGPLVNLAGEAIGITTAIASGTGFYQGYGFAVPINLARRVMRDLMEDGRVHRALLGVTIRDVDPDDARVYGLPAIRGVLVQDFGEGSPARAAGLERHDVIVGLNGEPVERLAQLQRLVAQHRPGDRVRVEVIRYGERLAFETSLTEAALDVPGLPGRAADPPRRRGADALGFEVADLTDRLATEYGYREPGGALVTAIRSFSSADRKQVQQGDRIVAINREPIGSAREAEAALRRVPSGEVASLTLLNRLGQVRIVNLRVP